MKNLVIFLAVFGIFLAVSGVYAVTDQDLEDFLKKIAEKKGINSSQIKNISEVDFGNLPKDLNISNIDDSNLAIYKVETNETKPTFIITFSEGNFKKISQPQSYSTSLLNFGFSGQSDESVFLRTAVGVPTSNENGYVMLHDGSITGISTGLQVISGEGKIQIVIIKNGEAVGFENSIEVPSSGLKTDYDIQSREVTTFRAGDVISAYLVVTGDVTWKDSTSIIEITNN
ncbi:hypothetical protein HY448_00660 [Candidatus Pacearchaeota archaeon]|nr:hypothetical protein [Candidatus Pacearchaeota archaeon]